MSQTTGVAVIMPDLTHEQRICEQWNVRHVVGVDEAGRGAIAGPVVAAAVILPLDDPDRLALLAGVNDSKQLSFARREALYDVICNVALAWGVGQSTAAEIDKLGILPANAQAMRRALAQLDPAGHFLLIDGRERLRGVSLPQETLVRGDSLSLSVAAASVLAKVTRDRLMVKLAERFPVYGFGRHKGYCTRVHQAALQAHGPCPEHRQTFAPIQARLPLPAGH